MCYDLIFKFFGPITKNRGRWSVNINSKVGGSVPDFSCLHVGVLVSMTPCTKYLSVDKKKTKKNNYT